MRVSRANLAAIACLTESEWLSFPPPLLARPDAVAENLMTRASEKQQPQTHIKTPNLWRMNKSMPWTRSDRPFRKCFHRVWHYFNQDITYISSYFPRIAVTPFQKRVYSALWSVHLSVPFGVQPVSLLLVHISLHSPFVLCTQRNSKRSSDYIQSPCGTLRMRKQSGLHASRPCCH